MKIDRSENTRRTIAMMANFLHQDPANIQLDQNLRKFWKMTDGDFDMLEGWIERPISRSLNGYFQDVMADVSLPDLRNPKLNTIDDLEDLIWRRIPKENKSI
jgi:hypothetical protein